MPIIYIGCTYVKTYAKPNYALLCNLLIIIWEGSFCVQKHISFVCLNLIGAKTSDICAPLHDWFKSQAISPYGANRLFHKFLSWRISLLCIVVKLIVLGPANNGANNSLFLLIKKLHMFSNIKRTAIMNYEKKKNILGSCYFS